MKAGPVRARPKLEQQSATTRAYRQTLFHVLDALEKPAFLVCGDRIEHANSRARDRLADQLDVSWGEIEGRLLRDDPGCFRVIQIDMPPLN